MRKEFNVIIANNEKVIIDCNLYAEDFESAANKTLDIFKYHLYKYNHNYDIKVKAI